MDDPILYERIKQLDPAYAELVVGRFIPEVSKSLGRKSGMEESAISILENGIRLYLLCFLSADETRDFIARECEVAPEIAEEIFNALQLILPEGFAAVQAATFTQLNHEMGDAVKLNEPKPAQTTVSQAPIPKPTPVPVQPAPGQGQPGPGGVPTIRTMQGDMTQQTQGQPKENTYTSTQEAILKEAAPKPKGEVPPPPPRAV